MHVFFLVSLSCYSSLYSTLLYYTIPHHTPLYPPHPTLPTISYSTYYHHTLLYPSHPTLPIISSSTLPHPTLPYSTLSLFVISDPFSSSVVSTLVSSPLYPSHLPTLYSPPLQAASSIRKVFSCLLSRLSRCFPRASNQQVQ